MRKKNPYHDLSMWKGARPTIFSRAKNLRENMTETEAMLWEKLRNKKLLNYKFRRQHPINNYIVDFYCHKLRLIIEVDGGYHTPIEQKKIDKERSAILEFQDLKVIRFTNKEIIENLLDVIDEIKVIARQLEEHGNK